MNYVLTNMVILNGHQDMKPETGKQIFVRDGKIEKIAENAEIPKEYRVIDLGGAYLMPGFINMHMHIPTTGKPRKKPMNYEKTAKLLSLGLVGAIYHKICEANVKQDLLAGMTTIRAVGGLPGYDTQVRDRINAGKIAGPRILTSDYAISVPGGHMTGSVALPANSVEEAIQMVDDLHKNYHPDLIKVMITGGVLDCTVPGEPGILKMPQEYVDAVCKRAHELGYKVAAHVESNVGMEVALHGGVDTIEHGGKPDDEIIRQMKEKGTALIATLSPAIPFQGISEEFIGISEMGLINGKALFDNMVACISRCRAEGIPVGLGTDTGCPYTTQYDFWREMWYYQNIIGATPEETLYAATLLNAKIAGIDGETGSVDEGKCADFVISAKNPLEDLETLRNPVKVIARGEIFHNPKPKKIADVEKVLDSVMPYYKDYYKKEA